MCYFYIEYYTCFILKKNQYMLKHANLLTEVRQNTSKSPLRLTLLVRQYKLNSVNSRGFVAEK